MDMTRFLKRYLNVPVLQQMGGLYEGTIESVVEHEVRDRYTKKRCKQALMNFIDGERLILNVGMTRECAAALGNESNGWLGRRVRVSLRQHKSINRATGDTKIVFHRKITLVLDDAPLQRQDVGGWQSTQDSPPETDDFNERQERTDRITAEEIFDDEPWTEDDE